MRIGAMIDAQDGVQWNEWVSLARAAEEAGLYSFSLSEHYSQFHATPGDPPDAMDAWTVIAALAPLTQKLRFGTLVTPVTYRHPSVLARTLATIDHISGGRVELGIGTGWAPREHVQNGFAFPALPERFDMLEEQVEIIVRSWTEDIFDFEGRHYRLEAQTARPRALQTPYIPLIMGGEAKPRSARLAARYASEYNVSFASPEVARQRLQAVAAACTGIGRDPATLPGSLFSVAVLGETEKDVADRKKQAEELTGSPPAMVATWLVGTVEQAADRLGEYRRAGIERGYFKYPDCDAEDIGLLGKLAQAVA